MSIENEISRLVQAPRIDVNHSRALEQRMHMPHLRDRFDVASRTLCAEMPRQNARQTDRAELRMNDDATDRADVRVRETQFLSPAPAQTQPTLARMTARDRPAQHTDGGDARAGGLEVSDGPDSSPRRGRTGGVVKHAQRPVIRGVPRLNAERSG